MEFERKLDLKLILSIIATGLLSFTGVVIETAMNVTFPTLMKEFGVSLATVQWITTGYLLVLAIVIPTSAFLKKKFRSKTLFIAASTIFLTGTVLGSISPNFSILLFGRLLQGMGTGIALPLMFNIVMEQAPKEKIGMMMGAATLVVAMAPAVGPSVGGMIVNDFGWRMIFTFLLPILILSLIFGVTSIRQSSLLEEHKFSWTLYFLLAASFTCFILASSFAGNLGWTDFLVIFLFAASAIFLFAFCKKSLQSSEPLIHLEVFKNFHLLLLGVMAIYW